MDELSPKGDFSYAWDGKYYRYSLQKKTVMVSVSLHREAFKYNLGYRLGGKRGEGSKNMTFEPYLSLATI